MPREWKMYEFSPKDFYARLGLDPKDTEIEVFVYPDRIVVTALKR